MIRAKYKSERLQAAAEEAAKNKKKEEHPGELTCRFQFEL